MNQLLTPANIEGPEKGLSELVFEQLGIPRSGRTKHLQELEDHLTHGRPDSAIRIAASTVASANDLSCLSLRVLLGRIRLTLRSSMTLIDWLTSEKLNQAAQGFLNARNQIYLVD